MPIEKYLLAPFEDGKIVMGLKIGLLFWLFTLDFRKESIDISNKLRKKCRARIACTINSLCGYIANKMNPSKKCATHRLRTLPLRSWSASSRRRTCSTLRCRSRRACRGVRGTAQASCGTRSGWSLRKINSTKWILLFRSKLGKMSLRPGVRVRPIFVPLLLFLSLRS